MLPIYNNYTLVLCYYYATVILDLFNAGYEPGSDPAFCGILSTVVVHGERVDADYPILAGYEGWNYMAFVLLPILFISTTCQNRHIEKNKKKVLY